MTCWHSTSSLCKTSAFLDFAFQTFQDINEDIQMMILSVFWFEINGMKASGTPATALDLKTFDGLDTHSSLYSFH